MFPALFDQVYGQFFKEDNSVGFKIFKILISGCWCFKSAQKIAPATVSGVAIFVSFHLGFFWMLAVLASYKS